MEERDIWCILYEIIMKAPVERHTYRTLCVCVCVCVCVHTAIQKFEIVKIFNGFKISIFCSAKVAFIQFF